MKHILIFLFMMVQLQAGSTNDVSRHQSRPVLQEIIDHSGIWSYEVDGVDNGYEKGLLVISRTADMYGVQVQLKQGSLTAYDIQVQDNDLQFHVNLDGVDRITVVLRLNGNTLTGQAIAKDGAYAITAVRQAPEK